ncbi:MAG: 50S ribosomal protein L22 [Minisyncoccia bacterium]
MTMKTAKATLGNFRQAPRKMRLIANAVRGKKVSDALVNLDFIAKRASSPIKTLIASALANAKTLDIPTDNLVVKTIQVNGGSIMYRRLPAARGSAHPMRKRTSSVYVELGEAEVKSKKSKVERNAVSLPEISKEKSIKSTKTAKAKTKN